MILGHLFVLFFGGGGQLKEIKFNIKKFTSKKFILASHLSPKVACKNSSCV